MKYHVILWSMSISQTFGLFTSENVVFQKTIEVYINNAYWIVTFVHDLRPFTNHINQISSDLSLTNEIILVITKSYRTSNMTGYLETLKSLHVIVSLFTFILNRMTMTCKCTGVLHVNVLLNHYSASVVR